VLHYRQTFGEKIPHTTDITKTEKQTYGRTHTLRQTTSRHNASSGPPNIGRGTD